MKKIHRMYKVKILPTDFYAVCSGIENAVVVYNDRGYEDGNWLALREWTGESYTGAYIMRRIEAVYDLSSIGLDNYVLIYLEE